MDELDALIEDSYEDDGATEEVVLEDQAETSSSDTDDEEDLEFADDDSLPLDDDESEDGEGAPEQPGVTQPTQAQQGPSVEEYQQIQAELQQRNEEFQRQQFALQQLYHQRQQEQAAAEVAAFEKKLEEMDPDDAARERLTWLAQNHQRQLSMVQQQNQMLLQERTFRMQQEEDEREKPGAIKKAIEYYGLSESAAELLEQAQTVDQLDLMAQTLKAQRQRQTEKARAQKAANVKSNPAHRSGAGGKPSPQVVSEPKSLDDLVDQMMETWVS